MKFYNLKKQLDSLIIFSLQDIYLIDPNFRKATLYDWERGNKVLKIKNNAYIFSDFAPQDLDFYLISNKIYKPSYISTELALNHYSIIPEAVVSITAVTTNKTQAFDTPIAKFKYQTVKDELFFGYKLLQVKNHGVAIAFLEKTILDYLYLNTDINSPDDFKSLRWNKQELKDNLDWKKMTDYLAIFSSTTLSQRINYLKKYLKI